MSDIKGMINGLCNDAVTGIKALPEGKDKVMAQIGLMNALCHFMQIPGVLTGNFDELIGSGETKKKRTSRKPAAPATQEEAKEPPKAKVQTKAVEPEAPAEAAAAPVKEAAPVVEQAAAPIVDDETPSFESWTEEAETYYSAGLDELYTLISSVVDTPEEIEPSIDELMSDFSSGKITSFAQSSPDAFNAFLVYVKECAAAADSEAAAS